MSREMSSDAPREPRGFYWSWFALFTSVSMVVNGAHGAIKTPLHFANLATGATRPLWLAWKVAGDAAPLWFTTGSVGIGVLMPVALAFGSHALANPRPGVSRTRHAATVTLTLATVLGSFIMSFLAMQDMGELLLGLSPLVAAIPPVVVDIAVVSALAGLMAHSPRVAESAVQRRVSEIVDGLETRREQDLNRIVGQFRDELGTVQERLMGQFRDELGTVQERLMNRPTEPREPSQNRPTEPREPSQHRPVNRPTDTPVAVRDPLATEPETLAAELVQRGRVAQPAGLVARVITMSSADPGLSAQKIAAAVTTELPRGESISKSTVHRLLTAARELDAALDHPDRQLAAV